MTRLIIPLAITGSNMAPMLKYSNGVERSIEANRYIPLFHVNQSSFIFLETKISYLQNIGEFHGRNVSRRVLSNEFTVHDSTYRSLRNTILSFEREEWKGFQRFFFNEITRFAAFFDLSHPLFLFLSFSETHASRFHSI